MGATAYGDNSRQTNRFYAPMRQLFSLQPEGQVYLNRALANWQRDAFHAPYTPDLVRILGEPIVLKDMWNPDKVLRVEDIARQHDLSPPTQEAAATQMVFEDAHTHSRSFHPEDRDRATRPHWVRRSTRWPTCACSNISTNRTTDAIRATRLHLWVPPMPNDAFGGATWEVSGSAGTGAPLDHALLRDHSQHRRDPRGAAAVPDIS
jgi:carbamoyltransferase